MTADELGATNTIALIDAYLVRKGMMTFNLALLPPKLAEQPILSEPLHQFQKLRLRFDVELTGLNFVVEAGNVAKDLGELCQTCFSKAGLMQFRVALQGVAKGDGDFAVWNNDEVGSKSRSRESRKSDRAIWFWWSPHRRRFSGNAQ